MIIIIIRTAMSLILSTRTTFKEFSPIELFLASYWIQFPYHAIMLLLSIWGFFACPKEAQYTGCDIKRWQIGMLAIMWSALLLQLTFGYFNETIYGYYIMLIIIGCIPFYPRHTLNGHSIPPGKENALSGSSVMMATVSPSMVYTTAPVYSPYAPVGLMAPQQQQQQYSIQYAPVSIYPAHGQPIVQTSPGAMAPISQAYPVHVQVAQQPQQYSYRS
ncbi:hypothetical protein BDF19DRAFT_436004 [Syncephalis fuscata]|nr:hypothetical protein BDF19DRAFT_436004 [Syncephalis fuscata]